MKLKNMLMMTFLTLTIIPIAIVTALLYKSGFELSKESYTHNLMESLNVQADYISQAVESNMIADYRFATLTIASNLIVEDVSPEMKRELHAAITSYLGAAEDNITVCMLLNQEHDLIYAIGEKREVDTIGAQLPIPSEFTNQEIVEFNLNDGTHSIGIVTPVWDNDAYTGCLVSVYNKDHIFKIISSYYKIADTSTYICRNNGDIINARQDFDENSEAMKQVLHSLRFAAEGAIDTTIENTALSGYYKGIHNTPWYLVGFVDDSLIYSFTNQFLLIYIFIIFGVLLIDIALSFYFSRRVVKPLNKLIQLMEAYHKNLDATELLQREETSYVEATYLRTKFLELMRKISLVQHNFEGIYQLYQSSNMGDTNIDIDVANQTISSNKDVFQALIDTVKPPENACIVEKFTHCFCMNDQRLLLALFVEMRDEHLSITREIEVYTPYLEGKWFHVLVVPMYTNERLSRLFVQLRDVSNFKKLELESSELAKRDTLTGLYNRSGFIFHVENVLQSATKQDTHALLFIDIDYFKLVNDNFGHTAGDGLLRSVAKTLVDTANADDIVSRFGGDEFVLLLTQTSAAAVEAITCTLKEHLIYPFHTDDIDFVVSASIGTSIWQGNSPSTLDQLLQQADNAMYKAKRAFKQERHERDSAPPMLVTES